MIRRLCVFCGSSTGSHPSYSAAARELGRLLAESGVELVYGGGSIGLMGTIADTVMGSGGRVVGIIPEFLSKLEVAKRDVTELHIVSTMHQRKMMMFERSDAFIAMPGGIGTLDEFSEVVTWSQLTLHTKPIGLLDTRGYFRRLMGFFDYAVEEGFFRPEHRSLIIVEEEPHKLLQRILQYHPAKRTDRWIKKID